MYGQYKKYNDIISIKYAERRYKRVKFLHMNEVVTSLKKIVTIIR